MNKLQKKNRLGTGNAKGDGKQFTVKSVAETPHKVKCAVTTKELNAYQELVIRRVYCTSLNRRELVSGLKALQFCTYEVAIKSLLEQRLIFTNDYYSLMTEVER
ncbi:MAG: hypothetical protein SOT80_08010 [Candidatus Pseudoruminococcus sp.]|nr:hypothetical protein [Ruminococcus sp.]MDY2783321.1 hypothetical protein [Candidatus Pseudoruminococcus sp.]